MKTRDIFFLIVLLVLVISVAHIFACERAVMGGAAYTHKLLPAGKKKHTHLATLNEGNGISTTNLNHKHKIVNGKVKSSDGHIHDITKFMIDV